MSQQLSSPLSNGGSAPYAQPVANSVTGSPFTVAGTSVPTPELVGPAVLVSVVTEAVHLRIDDNAAVACDANDMLYPVGLHVIPVKDGQIISMLQSSSGAVVYIEKVRSTPN